MVEKLYSLVMGVETAFLYGEIDQGIFMKSPVGMEEIDPGSSSEDCYQLLKGVYGLCQTARQFWKKFVNTAKKESFGFQVSLADPCMLFKQNELGICTIIMYVDDMLIIGKKGTDTRVYNQNSEGIFCEDSTQLGRLPGL